MCDVLIGIFIRGGQTAVQITLLGRPIQPQGYCYLSFLIGILVASFVGSLLPEMFFALVQWLLSPYIVSGIWLITVLFGNLLATTLVGIDLAVRFYKPPK